MLCYAVPTSHFPAHAFSSSPRPSRYTSSSPYRCGPSSYLASNDEEEEYYEYLDAVRRQRERRELEQVQAERWARQEAARVQAQREARRAAAYIEYQQYLHQQQQESLRAQAVAEAQAKAQAQAKAIAQARARAIAEYRAREHARAIEAKKQQQQEQTTRRQIMEHIIRSVVAAASTPDTPIPAQAARPAVSAPPAPQQAPRPHFATKVSFASHVHIAQPQSYQESAIRQRLQQVEAISSRLEEARKAFVEPETLVFDTSATSSSPKLAYSPLNRPVQALDETLTKLLIDLDTITSDGHQQVKTARKQLAVAIEEELTKLESIKSALWMKQNKPAQENGVEIENKAAGAKPDEVPAVEEKSVEEMTPVTDAHEAEETDLVDRSKDEALDKSAVSETHDEQETSPPITETKEHKEEEAANPPDYTPPFTAEKVKETDASIHTAPTSLAVDASSSLTSSPQGINIHKEQSPEHIEQIEITEDNEQPAPTSHEPSETIRSLAHEALRPPSPSVTVTVTDEEDEEEQESAAYQDLSKALHAEVEPAKGETDVRDKLVDDASSESSFEMLE